MEDVRRWLLEGSRTVREAVYLQIAPEHPVHLRIVLGNESVDLDSVVSAISVANALNTQNKANGQAHVLTLPVLHCKRSDMRIKTESVYCIKRWLDLEMPEVLLSLYDDIIPLLCHNPEAEFCTVSLQEVVLVDHNKLSTSLPASCREQLRLRVAGVVDHHFDETASEYGEAKKDVLRPRRIAAVGSCATLVWEEFGGAIPECCTMLLQSAVLVDTLLFSPSAEKTTARDVTATEEMARALKWSVAEIVPRAEKRDPLQVYNDEWLKHMKKIFDDVSAAKEDISGLSVGDVLAKDYKQICGGVGMSSVACSMWRWCEISGVSREEMVQMWGEWRGQQSPPIHYLFVLTAFTDDNGFHRIIYAVPTTSEDGKDHDHTSNYFEAIAKIEGAVAEDSEQGACGKKVFVRRLPRHCSRKKLAPLLVAVHQT